MRKLLALLCLLPAPVAAQKMQFTFVGTAAQEIVNSRIGPAHQRLTGLILGGEGILVSDRFMARLRYGQGRVAGETGSGVDPRDIVEGEALFGFRATSWLTFWAGPSARAYTTGDADQRWFFWTGRASGRGTVLPDRMQTFVELWGALSGSVTNPEMAAGGRGAEAGLEMRLGGRSFWGRLAYRIESGHASDVRETVEAISLSFVYGNPQ